MNEKMTSFGFQGSAKAFMKPAKLNLVSLMDIFTILVFFLLLNSGTNQLIKVNDVTLPDSTAEERPKETTIVTITEDDILVDGRPVASINEVITSNGLINGLMKELRFQASKRTVLTEREKSLGRAVTILGDEEIPYALLKRVMLTCAKADYRDLSMAVSRVSGSSGA